MDIIWAATMAARKKIAIHIMTREINVGYDIAEEIWWRHQQQAGYRDEEPSIYSWLQNCSSFTQELQWSISDSPFPPPASFIESLWILLLFSNSIIVLVINWIFWGYYRKLILIANNCPSLSQSKIECYEMLIKAGLHH